ncbi:MAG: hypothetical protein HQL54_09415 [Magnetococcales bacterium]|nr:hypothetical protein [Magnetococcales bacterium]
MSDSNTLLNGLFKAVSFCIKALGQLFFGIVIIIIGLGFFEDDKPDPEEVAMAQWLEAPGTMGFINLESVQEAFNQSDDLETFYWKVNEIFEGDQLVLLSTQIQERHVTIQGCEDLNRNQVSCDPQDDPLFLLNLFQTEQGSEVPALLQLTGMGTNSLFKVNQPYPHPDNQPIYLPEHYFLRRESMAEAAMNYREEYVDGDFILFMAMDDDLFESHHYKRRKYRSSANFITQIRRNNMYEQDMANRHGTRFGNSINNVSRQRTKYFSTAKTRPGYGAKLAAMDSRSTAWRLRNESPSLKTTSANGKTRSSRFASSKAARSYRSSSGFIG